MSNLLSEAIVDAKALRAAALKNAETMVIEKYSQEVKKTLDRMLEQDDLDLELGGDLEPAAGEEPAPELDAGLEATEGEMGEETGTTEPIDAEDNVPLAATDGFDGLDGENLNGFPNAGESVELNIDLGALQEAIKELEESDTADDANIDALVDAIAEKLTVDMGATLSGWAGRSSESMKWEIEKELAHRRSTDVEEELNDLKKAQEELVFENNQLTEHNSQYKQAIEELKESLQDVNLSNARLLYTNRVLRNTSLNERQKEKIVEAISNAGSVTEAKMIHETLQSTVEAAPKRGPQSLSEAIGSRSSVIRATRKESTPHDPFSDRMKRLAGIE